MLLVYVSTCWKEYSFDTLLKCNRPLKKMNLGRREPVVQRSRFGEEDFYYCGSEVTSLCARGLVFLCFLPFHRLSSAHGLFSNTLDALDALTFLVQLSALKNAVDDGVRVDLRVWV